MKEYLLTLVRASATPVHAQHLMREYLQAQILGSLQRAGAMSALAFHGGTALRFLYALDRFSEDLDFALERPAAGYDFRAYLQTIRAELVAQGYNVELKVNDQKAVHSAFVRFMGLAHELGLSPHRTQIFAVKIEVDTQPPTGATLATSVIRRHLTLHLQHHDRATLLAGKLHAVLQRAYTKGRDLYDLLWYLSDPQWPAPNLIWLNHALRQSNWSGKTLTADNWRAVVRARVKALDWAVVVADVSPFVENSATLKLLTKENVLQVVGGAAR